MPRSEAIFTIVAPEVAGEGPVLARADSIFSGSGIPYDEQLVAMPDSVGDKPLERGMRLKGKGHIFIRSADEVRPHDLVILEEEKRPKPALREWY